MTQKLKFQEGKVTTKQVSVLARRHVKMGEPQINYIQKFCRFRNMMDIGTTSSEDRLRRGIRDLNTFAKDMLTKLQSDAPVNPRLLNRMRNKKNQSLQKLLSQFPKQEKITLNDLFELCILLLKKEKLARNK